MEPFAFSAKNSYTYTHKYFFVYIYILVYKWRKKTTRKSICVVSGWRGSKRRLINNVTHHTYAQYKNLRNTYTHDEIVSGVAMKLSNDHLIK